MTHTWEAMGTAWHITVLAERLPPTLWTRLERATTAFEQQFSRFLPSSEVNRWHNLTGPTTVTISPELAKLLHFAQDLKHLTRGRFDPAVGGLLEEAGYNAEYSLRPAQPSTWQAPTWHLSGTILHLSGPAVFDIGGYGKGYWIDRLSQQLTQAGLPHHLVDGGGDMFATTKPDGSGWRVAVQYPGKPDEALDVVTLTNQALAVSDTLQRQWGAWHHVVDPVDRIPAKALISAAVVAPTALAADAATTALMVSPAGQWPEIAQQLQAEYLALTPVYQAVTSAQWPGEI